MEKAEEKWTQLQAAPSHHFQTLTLHTLQVTTPYKSMYFGLNCSIVRTSCVHSLLVVGCSFGGPINLQDIAYNRHFSYLTRSQIRNACMNVYIMQWSLHSASYCFRRAIWKSDCRLLAQTRPGRTLVRRKSTPQVPAPDGAGPVKLSWYHILWKPAAFTAGVRQLARGARGTES